MASSCPPKKVALDNFLLKLNEIAQANPSISDEIQSLKQSIEEGMILRSGFVKRGGKKRNSKRKLSRKHRGGMPPKRNASEMEEADDAVLSISDADRSALLNAMAHIISVGTITGGSAASMCYIVPAIESFLVSKGLVPMLCSGSGVVGMVEWGFRILAAPLANIETCMAIQTRYDLIITRIITAIGIPTGFGILYERAKIKGGYLAYKNAIYKILKYCVDGIKAIFTRSAAMQEPKISDEELKSLVDEAIRNEFPELMQEGRASHEYYSASANSSMAGPSMASTSMASTSMAGPSMAGPSMSRPSSSLGYAAPESQPDSQTGWFSGVTSLFSSRERSPTPPPAAGEEYGSSGFFGGTRRHRKRKTAKKRGKTTRSKKLRKHRTRRHR
jgi:hypothetical protein